MPQKRYRPEEIIAKLREAEVLLGQGQPLLGTSSSGDSPGRDQPRGDCQQALVGDSHAQRRDNQP